MTHAVWRAIRGVIPGARGAVLAALLRTDTPLTGRHVYALVSDHYSLWTVQEALKTLTRLGLVNSQTIGRAGVHTINEDHVSVAPLRALLDPIVALTDIVREVVGDEVTTVILFGSIARGEPTSKAISTSLSSPRLAGTDAATWRTRFVPPRQRLRRACLHPHGTSPTRQQPTNPSFGRS